MKPLRRLLNRISAPFRDQKTTIKAPTPPIDWNVLGTIDRVKHMHIPPAKPPVWEVIAASKVLSIESAAEAELGESGVRYSWSDASGTFRHRWDSVERRIFKEKLVA